MESEVDLIEDLRERLEEGIRRQPVEERMALLERLLADHESYGEIMALWDAEVERRVAEFESGEVEGIPAEVVLARLRAMLEEAEKDWQPPPVPEDIDEIEKQALQLMNDEFCDLLVNVEAELPPEIDPEWRSGIRARIQAVPAEFERRYREQEEYDGYSQAEQPQPTDRA
jgi:hypothetical protein